MKKALLYCMVLLYASAGIYHFINPDFYKSIMPSWLPCRSMMNNLAGVAEFILAIALVPERTRKISVYLVIAMLVVFLVFIHIPMAVSFYQTKHTELWITILRLPIQIVLIWWACIYVKPLRN